MIIRNAVACGDDYTTAASIAYLYDSNGGYAAVRDEPVMCSLAWGRQGDEQWTNEFRVEPGNLALAPNVIGIRFRNAVAGSVATITAVLSSHDEPSVFLTAAGVVPGTTPGYPHIDSTENVGLPWGVQSIDPTLVNEVAGLVLTADGVGGSLWSDVFALDLASYILSLANLDAFWKLNEDSGDIAHDSADGYDLDSGAFDPPTWGQAAGPPGEQSALFGTGKAESLGTFPAKSGAFTAFCFVARHNNLDAVPMSQGSISSNTGWELDIEAFNAGSGNRPAVIVGDGGAAHAFEADSAVVMDAWNFLAVRRTAAGLWQLYFNGAWQTGSYSDGGAYTAAGGVSLGNQGNITMSYAAVFNRALTDAEVDNIYALASGASSITGWVWTIVGGVPQWAPPAVDLSGVATEFYDGTGVFDTVKDSDLSTSDITTNDVTTAKHGFAPKAPNDATKFLDGTAAYDTVKDTDLSTSDNTTNDVSTSKHGFTPKAPNDSAKFLRGDATWAALPSVPPGSAVVATDAIWDAKGDLAAATGADAAVRVAVGANGTILKAASGETAGIKWVPGIGMPELIYRYTVTGSDKASIDTGVDSPDVGSNDWTNGDLLELFIYGRTDESVVASFVHLTLNNDSGNNYDTQRLSGIAATASAASLAAQSSWQFSIPGASNAANVFGMLMGEIPNFAGTVGNKVGQIQGGWSDTSSANSAYSLRIGMWRSTSAITRLKIIPVTAAKKFKVGTQLAIYKRLAS